MDSAYVPALAAFGGSAVGGLTSLMATWVTQRRKDSVRRLAQERVSRDEHSMRSPASLTVEH